MAKHESIKGAEGPATPLPSTEADPLAGASVYRLRRDALMIVASQHRGYVPRIDSMKKHLVYVQGQLCRAALADPSVSARAKTAMLAFHSTCVSESIDDRRGSQRRFDANKKPERTSSIPATT